MDHTDDGGIAELFQAVLDKEEEVFEASVVDGLGELPAIEAVQRLQTDTRLFGSENFLPRQHQRVRVVDLQERLSEVLLCIFKIDGEDCCNVFRRGLEFHVHS